MAGAKKKKGDGKGKSDGLFKYSISLQMQRESISKFEGSVDSGQRESTEVSRQGVHLQKPVVVSSPAVCIQRLSILIPVQVAEIHL